MAATPPRWTIDPNELDEAYYWSTDGEGTLLATEHNLPGPYAAVMCSDPSTGDGLYMFSGAGGSRFFLWDRASGDVYEVTQPNTEQEIMDCISNDDGQTAQLQITQVFRY